MKKHYLLQLLSVVLLFGTIFSYAQETTIYGIVSYHNDGVRVLPNVEVLLYGEDGDLYATTTSNEDGYYEILDVPNGTYTLTGSYSANAGGVDLVSALIVKNHALGFSLLEDVFALIAADVNGDGQITMSDYVAIKTGKLIHGNPFVVGDWVFEELTFTLDDFKGSNAEKGLGGSSAGDVAGAFEPTILNSTVNFLASSEMIYADAGEYQKIFIRVNENYDLSGAHMIINYPSHLVEIIDIESPLNDIDYVIQENRIVLNAAEPHLSSYYFRKGSDLVTFTVRISDCFAQGDLIKFELDDQSHFVNTKFEKNYTRVSLPAISMVEAKSQLLPNYPNPFNIQTKINYEVAAPSFVNVSVYGIDGMLVKVLVDEYQNQGTYQVEFNRGNIAPGTYLLRLNAEGSSPVYDTRVMIITSN